MSKILVSPSILSADFANLQADIDSVIEAGADRVHFDVMDGNFVPNISFGAPVLKCLTTRNLPIDVHLMIEHPWDFYDDFVSAGKDCGEMTLIIHSEVCEGEDDLRKRLLQIKEAGALVGVSIKPATSVAEIESVLDILDQVLVMSVEPGFGGQKFMADMIPKVKKLRDLGYSGHIGVDGGISPETVGVCIEAGADVMGVGSAVFNHIGVEERRKAISALRGE